MLIPNWSDVLLKAWSVRFILFGAALDTAQNLLPYVSDFLPWWVPPLVTLLGFASRFVDQGLASDKGGAADGSR